MILIKTERFVLFSIVILVFFSVIIGNDHANNNESILYEFQKTQLEYATDQNPHVTTRLSNGFYRSHPWSGDEVDIAVNGFALAGLVAAVERGDITHTEGHNLARKTIRSWSKLIKKSYLGAGPAKYGKKGFLYHYYTLQQGEFIRKDPTTEVSTIDTALLVAGIITAGEYFGGKVKKLADKCYKMINWRSFFDESRMQFWMAWKPESGFYGWWDYYTDEIILISLLAIGAPNKLYRVPNKKDIFTARDVWNGWKKEWGTYPDPHGNRYRLIHSWFGSYFTYLYAHLFFDFKKLGDDFNDVNWWENSVEASKAAMAYALFKKKYYGVWGLSACYGTSNLYLAEVGSPPWAARPKDNKYDCVATYASASAIVFFSENLKKNIAFHSFKNLYKSKNMTNWTGFISESVVASDPSLPQACDYVVGMNVMCPAVSIENFRSKSIWNAFMSNKYIQQSCSVIFPNFSPEQHKEK
jgi:hypothetical protein